VNIFLVAFLKSMSQSVHNLREQYIKRRLGIPEASASVLNNATGSNLRNEVVEESAEDQEPVPWAPQGYYTSLKDFNEDLHNVLGSLKDEYGEEHNIEYGSKEAILNVRRLFQNIGELYVERELNK
jgi:hypothetical protein